MIPLPREGSSYHRKDGSTSNRRGVLYVPGSTPDTGNGLPALDRNPYNGYGYVKPYYWLDEFIPYYVETMGVDPPDRTNIPGKRRTRSKGSSKERCLIFADMSINGLFCCGKTHIEMKDADFWILISSWSKWCLLSTRQKSINKSARMGWIFVEIQSFFVVFQNVSQKKVSFFLFPVPKRKGCFPRESP